ncbi:secreted antigen 1 [Babesia caballi]|uniref:Secreted antigen 1 n=1 Tax=Babesia caballi TaxID=5871 RepID=A0AAV4M2F7_BABCB|nr:secreted antigen 1 [Babesia caballi]
MAPGCASVTVPTTLKEALKFAGALGQGNLKDSVGKVLQARVSRYSDNIAVDTYFTSTLNNLEELRQKLDKQHSTYGSYTNLPSQPGCLADTVSDCFPTLYCTLFYLNFNVNGSDKGGGKWANQQCNSGSILNWLENGTSITSPSSPAKIWRGGFDSGEVKCSQASDFSSQLSGCLGDQGGSKFEMLLSGILFLNPSFPELTSTFLVFVSEVCCIVSEQSQDEDADDGESRKKLHAAFEKQYKSFSESASLKASCKSLRTNIEKLIGKGPSGDDGALQIPRNSHKLFKEKLHSDKFPLYLTWLSRNLPSLIAHLKQMESDCEGWEPKNMSGGQAAGPFPYGFGFPKSGSWNQGTVQSSLQRLIGESSNEGLFALQRHVKSLIASSTSSSTGAAVGGFLGTATVGGGAAAVYFNVGGSGTIIKGLLKMY